MLKGHVFKEQVFESQVFAYFIDEFLNHKCGVGDFGNKMQVTHNGNNVTIQDGLACIRGRFIEEDSSTTLNAGTDTAYCKLVLEIDLDKENSEETLNQVSYKIVKSTTAYPNLTQKDIVKNNAGKYQYELARFRTSTSGISDFQDKRTYFNLQSIYSAMETDFASFLEQLKIKIANVENGSAYMLKNKFAIIETDYVIGVRPPCIKTINYPSGFNKSNTIILSLEMKSENSNWISSIEDSSLYATLNNSNITLTQSEGNGFKFRITLMKAN